MSGIPQHFYAFIGDEFVLGFNNAMPSPYNTTDSTRSCVYRTAGHSTAIQDISAVVSDTWLEMVVPRAHDGVKSAFDPEHIHAVKVTRTGVGLDTWRQTAAGAIALNAAVAQLAVEPVQTSVGARNPMATAIIACIGMGYDALVGSPALVQADYDELVMNVVTELRMQPWAKYAPFVAIVPGRNQALLKPTTIDLDAAMVVREAWMTAARKLNDLHVLDMSTVELEDTTFVRPLIAPAGLVELGESIARLLDGYRIGGTQRAARSDGVGFARFATESAALDHAAALVADGAPLLASENPYLGGMGSRLFGGVHVPWSLVKTKRDTFAPFDEASGDYVVPYDTAALGIGARPSTRGRGILPNRNAEELVGEVGAFMPMGLHHLGGAHWDSADIVDASGSTNVRWDPVSKVHRRRGTHPTSLPVTPGANTVIDGRVMYVDPVFTPTYVASTFNYGGLPSMSYPASRTRSSFVRNQDAIPRTRDVTAMMVFHHIGGMSGGYQYLMGAGWQSASSNLLEGGWSLAMRADGMRFRIRDGGADRDIFVTTVLGTGASDIYIAWARIQLDNPELTLARINGVQSPVNSAPFENPSNSFSDIRVGATAANVDSAVFTTPMVAVWRRPLSITEMRYVEAYAADRFSFTAP